MRPHSYYPGHTLTRTPLRVKLARAGARAGMWLAATACVTMMAFGVAGLVAQLYISQAKLDSAFLHGMQAGHQICPRGL